MSMSNNLVPAWTSAFRPYLERELRVELQTPVRFPAGRVVSDVASVFLRFPKWGGEPFVDDFGRKSAAMIELDGQHLFAELAVLRLLRNDGWDGRWVSTYSAGKEVWKYLTQWENVPRTEQKSRPIEESEPRQTLARIAGFNKPRRYKGCWDVFAWRSSQLAFVQCKRTTPKYKDLLSKDQEEWLRSALFLEDPRFMIDAFCVVQWDYQ